MACVPCKKLMTADELRRHAPMCPKRQQECKTCHESISVDAMDIHVATGKRMLLGRDIGCGGMVPCPYGCMSESAAGIVSHTPHASRVKSSNNQLRREHVLVIPRSMVEKHKAECPSRPASCSYYGCGYQLVHHELVGHKRKNKHAAHHLECVENARINDRREMEAKIARLMSAVPAAASAAASASASAAAATTPFPGYSTVYNDVFQLPIACITQSHFVWPTPPNPGVDDPFNHLVVRGVDAIRRFEFNATPLRDLDVTVVARSPVGESRAFALSIRLCRRGVVGSDANILEGVCTDRGTSFASFETEFTVLDNTVNVHLYPFSEHTLLDAWATDRMTSPGYGGQEVFSLFVELFEKQAL
jgi:hypothetical protein